MAFNFSLLNQLVGKVGEIAGQFGSENLKPVGSGRLGQQRLGKQADLKYNLLALLLRNAEQGQSQASSKPAVGLADIQGSPNFASFAANKVNMEEKGTVEGPQISGKGEMSFDAQSGIDRSGVRNQLINALPTQGQAWGFGVGGQAAGASGQAQPGSWLDSLKGRGAGQINPGLLQQIMAMYQQQSGGNAIRNAR